jgi:hypothetical protein
MVRQRACRTARKSTVLEASRGGGVCEQTGCARCGSRGSDHRRFDATACLGELPGSASDSDSGSGAWEPDTPLERRCRGSPGVPVDPASIAAKSPASFAVANHFPSSPGVVLGSRSCPSESPGGPVCPVARCRASQARPVRARRGREDRRHPWPAARASTLAMTSWDRAPAARAAAGPAAERVRRPCPAVTGATARRGTSSRRAGALCPRPSASCPRLRDQDAMRLARPPGPHQWRSALAAAGPAAEGVRRPRPAATGAARRRGTSSRRAGAPCPRSPASCPRLRDRDAPRQVRPSGPHR